MEGGAAVRVAPGGPDGIAARGRHAGAGHPELEALPRPVAPMETVSKEEPIGGDHPVARILAGRVQADRAGWCRG